MSFPADPSMLPPELLALLGGGVPPLGPPPPMPMPPMPMEPQQPQDPLAALAALGIDAETLAALQAMDEGDEADEGLGAGTQPNPDGMLEAPYVPSPRSDRINARIKPYELKRANGGKPPKKKSVDWIRGEAKRREEYWASRNRRMDNDLDLYLMTSAQEEPDSETKQEVVTKVTPASMVNKLSYMVGRQKDKISVDARGHGPEWEEAAQNIEDFLYHMRAATGRKHQSKLTMTMGRDEAWYAAVRGWIVSRVYLDAEHEFPICVDLFDPRYCYPQMGQSGAGMCMNMIYKETTTKSDFIGNNSWAADDAYIDSLDGDDSIDVIWYDDEWYSIVVVDEVVVKSVKHGYGFCPWVVSVSGGVPIKTDPARHMVGAGMLTPIRATIKQMDRMLSKLMEGVSRYGNPSTKTTMDSDKQGVNYPNPLDTRPGQDNQYDIGKGENSEVVNVMAPPMETQLLWEALNDDIQKAGLIPVLWGNAEGMASGFHQAVAVNAGEDALFPITDCVIHYRQWVNSLALNIVLVAKEANVLDRDVDEDAGEVYEGVYYRNRPRGRRMVGNKSHIDVLSPEDVKKNGIENVVSLRRMTPNDIMMYVQAAAMAVQSNLLSIDWIRRNWLDVDDPTQMNLDIIYEFIFKDEEMMKDVFMPLALKSDPKVYKEYQERQAKRRAEEAAAKSGMMGAGQQAGIPGIPSQQLPPQMQLQPGPQSPGAVAALVPELMNQA